MQRAFAGLGRGRVLLLAAALASFAFMLSYSTSQAQASVGFCEFAKLGPGATCESSPFTEVVLVLAEVTSGSAEICVGIHESSGVLLGKECGKNFAESQGGVGASSAKAWVKNNSGSATVTVFGTYLT